MAQGTKTENTAVNRLIEMAHTRSVDTDDALFSTPSPSARKPPLPRPFPGRMTVPVDPPAPLPRTRAPHSTQTQLAAAPPAARPSQRPDEVSTLPFDQIDEDLLDSDDVDDDDMPITIAEAAPRPAAMPAALPPLTIGPVTPLAARPSALGAVPGLEEASWFEESVGVDRFDETSLGTQGVPRSSRARTMLWLSAAFAAGLVATAIVAWPGRSPVAPALPAPAVMAQPAAVVTPAPALAPVTPPAAEPAVIAPPLEPPVAEPAVAVPTVVEPELPVVAPVVAPTPVTIGFASEPAGATVLLVDGSTTVTLGVTPLEHALDPSRSHELMFTLAGHRSTLVTVDPSASARVTVDLTSSMATVEAAPAKVAPRPAPQVAKAVKAAPAAKAALRVAKLEPSRPAPVAGKGAGTLMLGAKPPCDIFIDGKATGLKTPQRAIKVAAGPHKVTLVNREHKITESFSIAVKAGAATKVVKDLSKRMK